MKYAVWFVVIFASSIFAATMSHEEAVVRQAYVKLAYAAAANNVQQLVEDAGPDANLGEALRKIGDQKVQFELSEFKVGNISDIKGYYDEYIAEPDGHDVLAVTQRTFTETDENKKVIATGITADVQWTRGDHTIAGAWKIPAINWLSREIDGVTYKRYASYRVILKFQGRERDYRALALFAPKQPVLIVDLITGNSALTFFAKRETDVSPTLLTNTDKHNNPIVEEWLRKNQPPPSTPKYGVQNQSEAHEHR